MKFLEPIRTFIESTETKTFYYYIIGYLSAITVACGLIIFFYFSQTNTLKRQIKRINNERENEVLTILETAMIVDQQRKAVDAILLTDTDFKIAGYFKNLLIKLNIKDKEVAEETSTTDREDNYRESELNAKFEDMNMKELTELLQELEQEARITTKRLEITKSKKKAKAIEAQITIATLLPKTEVT
jgi:hypothetical protein